ncbi:hypothetical protein Pint_24167 [Pistacia integerrima]|uniref:Uncharacterized protein n=1 Tax=Pistacia integerrima TaxID=434235 RepID=A0ACC0Y9Z1_9ROSI|nr:hypothetical protein Pint_24167 [Pistacia integerrima]
MADDSTSDVDISNEQALTSSGHLVVENEKIPVKTDKLQQYQDKLAGIRQGLISGFGFGVSFFFSFFVFAVSFYVGGILVNHGKATFSEFLHGSTASIFGLLDQKSKIDSSVNSGMMLKNVKGEVEFQHVSFKYPTRPDIEVLRDVCLTIHSGKLAAIYYNQSRLWGRWDYFIFACLLHSF